MNRKMRLSRGLVGAAILVAAELAGVVAIEFAVSSQAQAQFFGDSRSSYRPRPQRGGFFDGLFGPSTRPQYQDDYPGERSQPADNSRAPNPRKVDKADVVAPTTSIVVLGDGMADWLAYGLEDAFADSPEIAIIRKNKQHSGLLRYDAKNDLDWWHAARDILGQEKPNYVVMMLGISDRQNIRERDLAKEAEKKKEQKDKAQQKDSNDKTDADKSAQKTEQADDPEKSAIIAPEPQQTRKTNGIIEFRSDQWEKIYARRIDETVAALKSKGVPVFWVGLPSIRGPKSTADAVYLNDLYRARAEKAGAVYIDVWDGFVDEGGKFTTYGPDYEGQMRRLRSGDGVYFTKYGARKVAHYVEREIRRYMSNRGPMALPAGPMGPVPADGKPAARPLAGPVVPLTVTPANSDELLGGSGSAAAARGDAIATGVLVKGDAVSAPSGRADDFVWPRGSVANAAPAAAATIVSPAAASASAAVPPAAAPSKPEPAPVVMQKPAETKPAPAPKVTQNAAPRRIQRPVQARPQQNAPRPPQPVRRSSGPFDWLR